MFEPIKHTFTNIKDLDDLMEMLKNTSNAIGVYICDPTKTIRFRYLSLDLLVKIYTVG